MTTITATVANKTELKVLKELFERFGIQYTVDEGPEDYNFSNAEIAEFIKRKQEYLNNETTARDWEEIKKELDLVYS